MIALILREYISSLTENDGLDLLLNDLLLAMGITPIIKPQKGVRQAGVDILARGKDKGVDTLFLITIKMGDITRSNWGNGLQAVHQSLDDIREVYITSRLSDDLKALPKKIILVCGGDLKQEVHDNWTGYVTTHMKADLSFELWNGDSLALKIERFLLNENVFPANIRSYFRKVLALLDDTDYTLKDLRAIVDIFLLEIDYSKLRDSKLTSSVASKFNTLNLLLNIIYVWAKNNDNLKPALKSSELVLMAAWHIITQYNLFEKPSIIQSFGRIFDTTELVFHDYYEKTKDACYIENALYQNLSEFALHSINIFEHLGFICIYAFLFYKNNPLYIAKNKTKFEEIQNTVKAMIINHRALNNPMYDNHIIEISLAILVLISSDMNISFIADWIQQLSNNIFFAYSSMLKYYPVYTDSLDDVLKLCENSVLRDIEEIDKTKCKTYLNISTLLASLVDWCCILNLEDVYKYFQEFLSNDIFKDTHIQTWYPDEETEKLIYIDPYKAVKTGIINTSLDIKLLFSEYRANIKEFRDANMGIDKMTAIQYSCGIMYLIASRHNRIPIFPIYWQSLLDNLTSDTALQLV